MLVHSELYPLTRFLWCRALNVQLGTPTTFWPAPIYDQSIFRNTHPICLGKFGKFWIVCAKYFLSGPNIDHFRYFLVILLLAAYSLGVLESASTRQKFSWPKWASPQKYSRHLLPSRASEKSTFYAASTNNFFREEVLLKIANHPFCPQILFLSWSFLFLGSWRGRLRWLLCSQVFLLRQILSLDSMHQILRQIAELARYFGPPGWKCCMKFSWLCRKDDGACI